MWGEETPRRDPSRKQSTFSIVMEALGGGFVIALIVHALAAVLVGDVYGAAPKTNGVAESRPSIERQAAARSDDAQQESGNTATIPPASEALSAHPCGQDTYCYQAEDLQAQQDMAAGTTSLVRATWYGVFISAFATILIFLTLRESRKATAAAADAAVAAHKTAEIAEREVSEANRPRMFIRFRQSLLNEDIEEHRIYFILFNEGERIGVLEDVRADLVIAWRKEAAPKPDVVRMSKTSRSVLSQNAVVKVGGNSEELRYRRYPNLAAWEIESLNKREGRLYFVGIASYRDHVQNVRELGFCYEVALPLEHIRDEAEFSAVGGEEYNYDRKKR